MFTSHLTDRRFFGAVAPAAIFGAVLLFLWAAITTSCLEPRWSIPQATDAEVAPLSEPSGPAVAVVESGGPSTCDDFSGPSYTVMGFYVVVLLALGAFVAARRVHRYALASTLAAAFSAGGAILLWAVFKDVLFIDMSGARPTATEAAIPNLIFIALAAGLGVLGGWLMHPEDRFREEVVSTGRPREVTRAIRLWWIVLSLMLLELPIHLYGGEWKYHDRVPWLLGASLFLLVTALLLWLTGRRSEILIRHKTRPRPAIRL